MTSSESVTTTGKALAGTTPVAGQRAALIGRLNAELGKPHSDREIHDLYRAIAAAATEGGA